MGQRLFSSCGWWYVMVIKLQKWKQGREKRIHLASKQKSNRDSSVINPITYLLIYSMVQSPS